MKCIFISIPYGMSARNILRNNLLDILRRKVKVVIFTPLYKDENFKKEFCKPNVEIKLLKHKYLLLTRVLAKFLIDTETYPWQKKIRY